MTKVKAKVPATKKSQAATQKDASYSGNMSLSMTLSPEQGLNRYPVSYTHLTLPTILLV